jgi:AAA domain
VHGFHLASWFARIVACTTLKVVIAAALQHLTGEPALAPLARSHRRVFLAPPWPEIYATDAERRHGFDAAVAEYQRLLEIYPSLGYEPVLLPKAGTADRAEFVLPPWRASRTAARAGGASKIVMATFTDHAGSVKPKSLRKSRGGSYASPQVKRL